MSTLRSTNAMLNRPDLSRLDPAVRDYIEALENEIDRLHGAKTETPRESTWSEPPTSLQVITISAAGWAKRTPRHLYARQKRGGMGVFDLETAEDDPPRLLALADAEAMLLLVTNHGRAFRLAVSAISERPVRGRGEVITASLNLLPDESLVAALPADGGAYLLMVSERGWVRRVHRQYLNERMLPGMRFHKLSEGGLITAATWTTGADDLCVIAQSGVGVRFAERLVPSSGCLGLRLAALDRAIGVVGVTEGSGVLLLGPDGKGAIRLMSGFRENKAPGAGGKALFTTERVVGAAAVALDDDVFILSRLGKIIRFVAEEIPPKTGVVQGVQCMNLRGDETVTLLVSPAGSVSAE